MCVCVHALRRESCFHCVCPVGVSVYMRICLRSLCVSVYALVCDRARMCVPQQLRIGLFLSGLNGNTELSESTFPLWGPSVATAWNTTYNIHVRRFNTRDSHAYTDTHYYTNKLRITEGQRHNNNNTLFHTHLSDGRPVLQYVQVRKHVDNIWAWAGLRTDTL